MQTSVVSASAPPGQDFDLFKLSLSKQHVGLAPNTVRTLIRSHRLNLYRLGRLAMISKQELAAAIRSCPEAR
jgi:hypothetical protein